jgi:tRNA G26 N,N-dimethylase Trm1
LRHRIYPESVSYSPSTKTGQDQAVQLLLTHLYSYITVKERTQRQNSGIRRLFEGFSPTILREIKQAHEREKKQRLTSEIYLPAENCFKKNFLNVITVKADISLRNSRTILC